MVEQSRTLRCYYEQQLVGEVSFDSSLRIAFRYADSWLAHSQSFPISISLPLRAEAFDHPPCQAFFENLLPEEQIRAAIQQKYKIPEKNLWEFFHHFGNELAGALALTSETPVWGQESQERLLPLDFIYDAIENGQGLYTQVLDAVGMKFSLAGAQEKFPVIYRDGNIFVPESGQPTSHIVKVDMAFRNSQTVLNEFLTMRLAKAVGLNTADVNVISGKYPILIVKRYDRVASPEGIRRLHQEDFCQAQAKPSTLKYEERSGPTFADNYNLLKKCSRQGIPDLKSLLTWLAFNLIVGNNDSHSKNLSFLYKGREIRLAPFYDLLSTAVYGQRFDQSFAFKIGGTRQWDKMQAGDFAVLETQLMVRSGTFAKVFRTCGEVVSEKRKKFADDLEDAQIDGTMAGRLGGLIDARLSSFHKRGLL